MTRMMIDTPRDDRHLEDEAILTTTEEEEETTTQSTETRTMMSTRKEAADNEEIWAKTKTRTNIIRRINIPPLNTTMTMKTIIIVNHLRMMKREIKKKKTRR